MRRLGREDGSTLFEFALSATILFMVLFGIFAFCSALYSYEFVADAAHEATRYAMVRGSSCSGLTNCPATSAEIQTYVRGLGYPGIVPGNLTASTSWSGSNAPGNTVSVKVTYTYPLNIPFWPQSGTVLHLSDTSKMTITQ